MEALKKKHKITEAMLLETEEELNLKRINQDSSQQKEVKNPLSRSCRLAVLFALGYLYLSEVYVVSKKATKRVII